MYAQVIVDVPTQQTNHSFDYIIPDNLTEIVKPGIRVVVPFGRGGRLVQGFVVGVSNDSEFAGKVKPLNHVMDLVPVLTEEMLKLSAWLAEQTFSFQISCMKTMLPSVMRAKYEKIALIKDQTLKSDPIFAGQESIVVDENLTSTEQNKLSAWAKQNRIKIIYSVKNQAKHVKQLFLHRKDDVDYNQIFLEIPKNAKKQQALIKLFMDSQANKFSFSNLENNYQISSTTINSAIRKGWFNKVEQSVLRDPNEKEVSLTQDKSLTAEQKNAYEHIINYHKRPILIEGVTGSGKTEIYLQAIKHFLKLGKTALMLVPEISLTPQMVNRVRGRFGKQVAVLHSGLSQGEKYDEWSRIQAGEAKVVVGARSAVFAPLKNLGIIVIDEEHESSYKQEDTPRYHARDVAIWRGRYHDCPVVLGSATPSLESRARGGKGVYDLVVLKHRINHHPLPAVEIVDLRETKNLSENLDLSKPLLNALEDCLNKQEQSILLLNRRGFASFLLCRECGYVPKCPNCDISLTVHLKEHRLICHYCGHSEPIPKKCPQCGSSKIRFTGTGTEKVEQQLNKIFPEARIIRMDNDTTSRKGAHERLLSEFGSHKGDILLGTQMIAKGLDFPDVTLVGVINADTGLGVSDFRSSERTFQLLTQVSGRAGRADKLGRVYIQTYNPDNYAIELAAKQDYEQFYRREMFYRHQAGYPPYYFLIKITVSHKQQGAGLKMAYNIANQIKPVLTDKEQLLGPTVPQVARIKNRYYFQIVIKYKINKNLWRVLHQIANNVQFDRRKGFAVAIDNEPQRME